jgi:hypothetical protein
MKSKDGFVQAYNAQIAVDSTAQVIVAQDVTQSAVDSGQLAPMTDATKTNLGRYPEQASADAGYCSEANLEALEHRDIDGYVATGRKYSPRRYPPPIPWLRRGRNGYRRATRCACSANAAAGASLRA